MNNKGVKLHNGLCCELARYIAVSEKKTVNNKGLGSVTTSSRYSLGKERRQIAVLQCKMMNHFCLSLKLFY